MNEKVRSEIHSAILRTLINLLAADSPPIPLPPGMAASLASLGPDLYLIKLDPHQDSSGDQLRLLIHELNHLIQRLRAQLPESRDPHYREPEF